MAINLSSLRRNDTLKPPRVIIYGPHGVGKTTFAAGAPAPVMLPCEDGLGSIGIDTFPLLKSYEDFYEALTSLVNEDHHFESVIIDSLDWLEPLIHNKVAREGGHRSIEDFGYGKGYILANDKWREVCEITNYLRDEKNMCILMLAHCEVKRFDSPETEPYDRYQLKLHKGGSGIVQESVDAVLFANYRVSVTETKVGFNKAVRRAVGGGERICYTEERPSFNAKNRYQLPPWLPLNWDAFAGAMKAPPGSVDYGPEPATAQVNRGGEATGEAVPETANAA